MTKAAGVTKVRTEGNFVWYKKSELDTLFWNPDIVQVHHLDILAAPAIPAAGTGEGHGAFGATVEIVSWMVQLFL